MPTIETKISRFRIWYLFSKLLYGKKDFRCSFKGVRRDNMRICRQELISAINLILYMLVVFLDINQYVTNRIFHPYHLNESIFIFGGIRDNFSF